jgi:hypothetical protein
VCQRRIRGKKKMFKYLLTMMLTIVIGISRVALPQVYSCYSESGSTVELTVQDSIVSVKLDESRASWQGLFLSESGLDPTIDPEPICEGFSLLHVTSGYDPVALVQRLRNHPDVLSANLSFLDAYSNPIYLTETFVANFDAAVSQAQIDSMNAGHGSRQSVLTLMTPLGCS